MRTRRQAPSYAPEAAAALAADLRRRLRGEVRFDEGGRALYATDASNYRQAPIGVVLPRDVDDAVEAISVCRAHDAPVLPRGCGTSLSGETCNVAVVLDFSKYVNRVLEIDPNDRRARVEPGAIFDDLRAPAECEGLTVAFDTSTHAYATIGGMIGNNSCGVHSVLAQKMNAGSGRTEDNIHELDVLTYDGLRLTVGPTSEDELESITRAGGRRGEIYAGMKALRERYADLIRSRYPKIPRRVSGYNLPQLLPEHGFNVARALVGTEGTCATVLGATIGLVESPPSRALLVLGYPDIFRTGDHAADVLAAGPVGLEAIDDRLIENMRRKGLLTEHLGLLPEGGGWLLAEFGGDSEEDAAMQARALMSVCSKARPAPAMRLFTEPADQQRIWEIREAGLGATAFVPGMEDAWEGWEDSAVPPERVGAYLRDLKDLFDKYEYNSSLYGHFGQGCIHARINFDVRTPEGVAKWRRFLDEAADLVARHGGSLSGEHGDGQARAELLPKIFGEEIVEAFREFKRIWDPHGKMNPGKVVDPYPIASNLRTGPDYNPPRPDTHFSFRQDKGDFSRAALRCVGVGKCRATGGQVMCPSFMATREEEHSTRGRARLLFEMMRGDIVKDGWRSRAVHDALDLCLACKGCKSDCPVNVDMATYKAEFMSHYYEGRLRPRQMYSMGLIHVWARAAAVAPGLANWALGAQPFAGMAKRIGGIAQERALPAFASPTFKAWFRKRHGVKDASSKGRVMLWPDTFTNYLNPAPGIAAVESLERLGYTVEVPKGALCCGRPLYAAGMLKRARHLWERTFGALAAAIDEGTPIVGVEPSCVAAFRDELPNLFPDRPEARALSGRVITFAEFLERESAPLPAIERKAVVHFHCNHHAVIGKCADNALMDRLGLDHRDLNAGCCGMAGPFGFEKGHYDVSIECAERALWPSVRAAGEDTLVIADGFSCREQIAHGTERRAIHLAEAVRMSLDRA